jgi:hypothetical protein
MGKHCGLQKVSCYKDGRRRRRNVENTAKTVVLLMARFGIWKRWRDRSAEIRRLGAEKRGEDGAALLLRSSLELAISNVTMSISLYLK